MDHKTYLNITDLATDLQSKLQATTGGVHLVVGDPATYKLTITNNDPTQDLIISYQGITNFAYIIGITQLNLLIPKLGGISTTEIVNIGGFNSLRIRSNLAMSDYAVDVFGNQSEIMEYVPIRAGYGATIIHEPNQQN